MNGSLCIRGRSLLNPAGFGQALHQPHPLIFLLLSHCSSTGVFCFSFGPIPILAPEVVRGLSASRSAPSPSWPWRHFSVLDPEWTLRLLRTSYRRVMYCKTLFDNKHCYVMRNTFLVILIKLQFLIIFVSYCAYV